MINTIFQKEKKLNSSDWARDENVKWKMIIYKQKSNKLQASRRTQKSWKEALNALRGKWRINNGRRWQHTMHRISCKLMFQTFDVCKRRKECVCSFACGVLHARSFLAVSQGLGLMWVRVSPQWLSDRSDLWSKSMPLVLPEVGESGSTECGVEHYGAHLVRYATAVFDQFWSYTQSKIEPENQILLCFINDCMRMQK